MMFQSGGTYGKLTKEQMFDVIKWRLSKSTEFEVTVGIDSQKIGANLKVASSVVIWEIGKGGFYFRNIHIITAPHTLQEKIYYEAKHLIALSTEVVEFLIENELFNAHFIAHLDIGENGKTRSLIDGLVGWVKACGFECRIKPDSYAASCISDRHSKGGSSRDRKPLKEPRYK